jgi:hypothetical protein
MSAVSGDDSTSSAAKEAAKEARFKGTDVPTQLVKYQD